MKYFCLLLSVFALFCFTGCSEEALPPVSAEDTASTEVSTQEIMTLPRELLGVWVSADEGERNMVETISFFEDGSMTVELKYQGSDYGKLYGSCTLEGHRLICSITDGASPYTVEYEFRIDGRMLILTDDDGPAEYLRTS
ncbi:MAG: hypothetical protein IJA48_01935 [Oscillospiraceae bacterium]|nr:hypothetical protein [Oscillospiraceae bacterium]